jgi:hypothetical protein
LTKHAFIDVLGSATGDMFLVQKQGIQDNQNREAKSKDYNEIGRFQMCGSTILYRTCHPVSST